MSDSMSDDRSLLLSEAFDLVEAGKPEEARRLLEDALAEGRDAYDSPDAWWIYAYTLSEPAAARRALSRVLELDPNYPGAQELLQELNEQYPELNEVSVDIPLPPAGDDEPDFMPRLESTPSSQPGAPLIKPLSKAATAEVARARGSSEEPVEPGRLKRPRAWLPILLTAAAVLFIIIGILALLNRGPQMSDDGGIGAVQSTPIAVQITSDTTLSDGTSVGDTENSAFESTAASVASIVGSNESPQIDLTDIALTLSIGLEGSGSASGSSTTPQPSPIVTATAPSSLPAMGDDEDTAQPVLTATAAPVVPTEMIGEQAVEMATPTSIIAPIQPMQTGETPPITVATAESVQPEETAVELMPVSSLTALEQLVRGFTQAAPELTVFDSATRLEATALGETAVIGVCSGYGTQLRQDVMRAMAALASASVNVSGVDAVAVQLTDCASGNGIRIIGTTIDAAQQFAATGDDLPYRLSWAAL